MKQDADQFTPDFLDKPRRGRPRKPDALTPAERARRYRANKRAKLQAPPNPYRAMILRARAERERRQAESQRDA